MDRSTRLLWHKTLQQKHTKSLDAPSWFWTSVVDLLATHEAAYLDHCRRYPTVVVLALGVSRSAAYRIRTLV